MIARGENQEVPQTTPLRPSHGPTDVAQDLRVPSRMQAAMAHILDFVTLQEQELTAHFFPTPHSSTRRCSLDTHRRTPFWRASVINSATNHEARVTICTWYANHMPLRCSRAARRRLCCDVNGRRYTVWYSLKLRSSH